MYALSHIWNHLLKPLTARSNESQEINFFSRSLMKNQQTMREQHKDISKKYINYAFL